MILGFCVLASLAVAPSDDSTLVARERAQWEALKTRDTVTFARLMGAGVVDVDQSGIRVTTPASTARYVIGCQTSDYHLSDFRVVRHDSVALVTYKAAVTQTCWGQRAPSSLNVLTVYVRRRGDWVVIAHSETATT
jgi:hypothetical protein